MRLKILLVPFFIVMILVLSIGYIKPDIEVMMMKKTEIVEHEKQVNTIKTVINNISVLNGSLDTEQEAEKFMYLYLPETLNQEQVIDAFNFLAVQSGLVITSMDLTLPPKKAIEEPLIDPSANKFIAGGSTLDMPAVTAKPVTTLIFTLKGTVKGSYENIKDFYNRLSYVERYYNIHFFSLEASKPEAAGTAVSTDSLTGIFEAEYAYVPSKPIASAFSMPVFMQTTLDTAPVSALRNTITNPLPLLQKGDTGKPNPFK